jgi:carbonic anhydrase
VSALDREGRTIWITDAHRGDGKRYIVRADEILTAFVELELAIRSQKEKMKTMKTNALRILACGWLAFAASSIAGEPAGIGADDALSRLLNGDKRFAAGKSEEPHGAALIERRHMLEKEQKPFAVVLSCSDSRVPPELVFDVTLGDIFVVRTAGEVVDAVALGSIEYAIEHLGTHLVVVLGHQRCGAVSAAVSGSRETGDIPDVLKAILPAVEESKGQSGDAIDNAVRANARDIAKRLQSTGPTIAPRVQSGEVKIVAAYYSLDTGQIELLK